MKYSLVSLILVSIFLASHEQQPQKPQQPTSGAATTRITTIKELAKVANGLDIKSTMRQRMNPPVLLVTQDAFVFYQGSVPTLGDNVITPRSFPILIPLARKLQVNDLRQLLNKHPEASTVQWQNSFKLADVLLEQKSLARIASGTLTGDELVTRLYEYDAAISKLSERAAQEFADSRNLRLQRPGLILPCHTHRPGEVCVESERGTGICDPKGGLQREGRSRRTMAPPGRESATRP